MKPPLPNRPTIAAVPEPKVEPRGEAERKFREAFDLVARAFVAGVTWRERDELRTDLRRAVDVYFADKVAGK